MKKKDNFAVPALVLLLFALAAIFSILISLTACGVSNQTGGSSEVGGNDQIPNPWVDCSDMAVAKLVAGFDFTVPDSAAGLTDRTIQAVEDEIIQVIYEDGSDDNSNYVYLRKGAGSDDVSGDYNAYSDTQTVDVNGASVTVKGEGGVWKLATWTQGDYTYSISAPGFNSVDELTALAEAMQ